MLLCFFRRFCIAAAILLLAAQGSAPAANPRGATSSIHIDATSLTLSPEHMSGSVRLTSDRDSKDLIQVHVYSWTGQKDLAKLPGSDDLLALPSVFTVDPNSTQTVRIGLRGPIASNVERAYRVVIEEVALQGAPHMLDVLLRLNFPVFIEPAAPPVYALDWHSYAHGNGIQLDARNTGNTHLVLQNVSVFADAAHTQLLGSRTKLNDTVLAGQSGTWNVPMKRRAAALFVVATTSAGTLNAQVH